MKKQSEKLVVNVEFEEPLKGLLLAECEREDRPMASMIRVICKEYFLEQLFENQTHQPLQEKSGQLPYYPDELPESKQDEAGQNRQDPK